MANLSFESIPNGLGAISKVPLLGWVQVLAYCAVCEVSGIRSRGDWANYTDSPLRAFENELGVQEPVGFWDPLGLAADGDAATFLRRRESELKHGRISMLATMGYITPELTGKFPGMLS